MCHTAVCLRHVGQTLVTKETTFVTLNGQKEGFLFPALLCTAGHKTQANGILYRNKGSVGLTLLDIFL